MLDTDTIQTLVRLLYSKRPTFFLSMFSIWTLWRQFKKCSGHSWAHVKQLKKIVDPIGLRQIIFEYDNDGLLVRNQCSKNRPPIGQGIKTTRLMTWR